MVYGYARVSSKDQNLDRQIEELEKENPYIYIYIVKSRVARILNVRNTKK